ncbi:MAG: HAD-IC family P-type ATPase, partial [Chloroflexi bacterium]|nr:HAD-IC family P-type ATPase [Chloroflexota bacterium]
VMLTGDNALVGETIGQQAHVDEVHAGLMPDEKARIMEDLEREHGPVAMVGDGVNDAPALAAATVGIAMGAAGTDVALETADVVLMGDKLDSIPYAIQLSRRAQRVVWQNIGFALTVILVLVLSAFVINLPLPLGVVGHEGSTVIVVLNGLRLLTGRTGI